MNLTSVEELLRRRIGLDPATAGQGLVARATRARMKALGIGEAEADRYYELASHSEQEIQALVEEVVIPESWFFRDDHPYALLADRAAEGWLTDPTRPALRALSMPCARGEEPYSIAIALLERGLTASRFRVDAVDVSLAALESARRGVYSENAFRSRDLSFRSRHFRLTPEGYELSAAVKTAVDFRPGNLLDPLLLADKATYDVIFCRNLMIYFDGPARQQALANLERLLSPSGLLFLGHAEQLGLLSPAFQPAADRRSFAYSRVCRLPPGGTPKPAHPRVPLKRGPSRRDVTGSGQGVPPPVPTRRPLVASPEAREIVPKISPLVTAARLADQGLHDEAARLCEQEIRRGRPTAEPYYLLGVIRQAAGDRGGAERSYEKAVYLEPGHEEALLALSLLAQRRGDLTLAAGYRRRAERAFQEKHPR